MVVGTVIKLLSKKNNAVSKEEFAEHKKTVVYKDTCGQTKIAIETKIQAVSELQNNKLDNLDKKMESGFIELKQLIKHNH